MAKTRQRGTGVRVRSEAKAAVADRLLLEAQECAKAFDWAVDERKKTPRWRWRRHRQLEERQTRCLIRYMESIRAAQDVAKKGRTVDVG